MSSKKKQQHFREKSKKKEFVYKFKPRIKYKIPRNPAIAALSRILEMDKKD